MYNYCADGTWATNQAFMVAATRLGKVPNPKWCFSDTPFYPTTAVDYLSSNIDPLKFLVQHTFGQGDPAIGVSTSPLFYIACESIN
jgi:hypothetical protein